MLPEKKQSVSAPRPMAGNPSQPTSTPMLRRFSTGRSGMTSCGSLSAPTGIRITAESVFSSMKITRSRLFHERIRRRGEMRYPNRQFPLVCMRDDVMRGCDAAEASVVVVEAEESGAVAFCRFDLDDVRRCLVYDVVPVHSGFFACGFGGFPRFNACFTASFQSPSIFRTSGFRPRFLPFGGDFFFGISYVVGGSVLMRSAGIEPAIPVTGNSLPCAKCASQGRSTHNAKRLCRKCRRSRPSQERGT